MLPNNGKAWILKNETPGLVIVQITRAEIMDDRTVRLFSALWDDLLSHVGDGGVVVLNFRDVALFSSSFLGSLFRAHRKFEQRGVRFVACHLSKSLQEVFYVAGSKQPLEYMLNYSDTEELAAAKARRMVKGGHHGPASNDLA